MANASPNRTTPTPNQMDRLRSNPIPIVARNGEAGAGAASGSGSRQTFGDGSQSRHRSLHSTLGSRDGHGNRRPSNTRSSSTASNEIEVVGSSFAGPGESSSEDDDDKNKCSISNEVENEELEHEFTALSLAIQDSGSDGVRKSSESSSRGVSADTRDLRLAVHQLNNPWKRTNTDINVKAQPSSLPPPPAPLLVSRGSRQCEGEQPPPIELTENTDTLTNVSYGSLRSSQEMGRFSDGPASYRDRQGQIHVLLRHKPQSDNNDLLHFLIPPRNKTSKPNDDEETRLPSLADRIMARTSVNVGNNSKSPTLTSTLTSLMDGKTPLPNFNVIPSSLHDPLDDDCDHEVFSTSLTALEVLHEARRHPDILRPSKEEASALQEYVAITTPLPQEEGEIPLGPALSLDHEELEEDMHHHNDVFELEIE